MLILLHIDWFGSAEELQESDNSLRKACDEIDGVKYKGRFTPNQKKYHWTYLFKAENLASWEKAWEKMSESPRDYNKLTHGELEYYQGPFHE
jgi:hypothetical protein